MSYELRHKALTQLINLHKFKDGQYFLDVEFKNVLRYIIFSIAESLIDDKGAAIKQIKDILSRPSAEIARKIIRYDNRYLTDAFVTAIRENDAEKLYELAEAHYKSLWKQRLIRKIILFFT